METKEYLKYIVEEIHTTIVATVDDEGLPVTVVGAAYQSVPRAVSLLPGFRMS